MISGLTGVMARGSVAVSLTSVAATSGVEAMAMHAAQHIDANVKIFFIGKIL